MCLSILELNFQRCGYLFCQDEMISIANMRPIGRHGRTTLCVDSLLMFAACVNEHDITLNLFSSYCASSCVEEAAHFTLQTLLILPFYLSIL